MGFTHRTGHNCEGKRFLAWSPKLTVVFEERSRRKAVPSEGGVGTAFEMAVVNATHLPSGVMLGAADLFVWPTLTSLVMPDCKSLTKMSGSPLVSFATRSEAALSKTTQRPSGVSVGFDEGPFPLL